MTQNSRLRPILAAVLALAAPAVALAQSAGGGTPVTQQNTSVSNVPTASTGAMSAPSTSATAGTSTTLFPANASRQVMFVENEAAVGGGNVAVCPSTVTSPGVNVAGCKTLYPGQNWAPCSASFCPAEAFVAVGSAASVPLLAEQK